MHARRSVCVLLVINPSVLCLYSDGGKSTSRETIVRVQTRVAHHTTEVINRSVK